MAWSTSTRRSRLPKDWPSRREATRERADGRCEGISLDGGPRHHATGCSGIGRECDHHVPGDDHSLANLRWLSTPCHKAKTQAESAAARAKQPTYRALREPERHPGLL